MFVADAHSWLWYLSNDQHLGVKHYVRYMDDFVLFSDSKKELHDWRRAMQNYLEKELKLDLPEE